MRTVDHIVPIAAGGARLDAENFCSLCPSHDGHKRNLERHYSEYFLRLLDRFGGEFWDKAEIVAEIFDSGAGPRVINL